MQNYSAVINILFKDFSHIHKHTQTHRNTYTHKKMEAHLLFISYFEIVDLLTDCSKLTSERVLHTKKALTIRIKGKQWRTKPYKFKPQSHPDSDEKFVVHQRWQQVRVVSFFLTVSAVC